MVTLFPDQQQELVNANPDAFAPVKGKWGLRGATSVRLKNAKKVTLRNALRAAWLRAAPRRLAASFR